MKKLSKSPLINHMQRRLSKSTTVSTALFWRLTLTLNIQTVTIMMGTRALTERQREVRVEEIK